MFAFLQKTIVKSTIRHTSTALTVCIGAFALFILGSLLPIEGNYEFKIVVSGSMEPTIGVGSIVAIIPRETYAVGDVVTFGSERGSVPPTTHRLIAEETSGGTRTFTTKGDANEDPDYRRISDDEIIGKVFLTIPYAGYVAQFIGTSMGMWIVIILPLSLYAAYETYKYLNKKEKIQNLPN